MNYPVWFLPETGGGFLIALIAILHVFVSHFAVGGGLYLIYAEKKGLRENSSAILDFTRRHARFFLLVTMVFGSITGVGFWFIISLVNPAATSLLIHTFVFGWAAEWVFFVVEITAAFIYFYMFGRMASATHLKIGWVYFISAWMSLFLINGIICFMLTPGGWLESKNFWIGFFNPSFFPSLFFRTFIAVLMAGVYGCFSASFEKNSEVKIAMTRFSGKWSLIALAGAIPSGIWYVAVLPEPAKSLVLGKSPTITFMTQWGLFAVAALLAIVLLTNVFRPALNKVFAASAAMICALVFFGSFEWIREAARRPYAINEIVYSNMILKDEIETISSQGFLKSAKWVENREITEDTLVSAGKEIFIHQCYACHTVNGLNNDIVPLTAGMSFNALKSYIKRIHQVRYFMPPFAGTDQEIEALSAYLASGLHGKEVTLEQPGDSGVAPGAGHFENQCSACHAADDLAPAFEGLPVDEIGQMLASLDQISDEMVPFEGSEEEATELAEFLYGLNNEAPQEPTGVDGSALFENNCSACHAMEDIPDVLSEYTRQEVREALDKLEELSDEMVPFEGSAEEKETLTDYLIELKGE